MKKYVFEFNYDVEIFDDMDKALEKAFDSWNHLTNKEKEKLEYFQVYEIEVPDDMEIDETVALGDYMTKEVRNFKEDRILYTAEKETGTFIERVYSVAEGKDLIERYEENDKLDETYCRDFYDIVDEYHNSVL